MANPFEMMKKGMAAMPPVKGKKPSVKEEAAAEGESVPFEKKEIKAGDKDDKGKKKGGFPFKKKGKC
jgi:hypothetical protein